MSFIDKLLHRKVADEPQPKSLNKDEILNKMGDEVQVADITYKALLAGTLAESYTESYKAKMLEREDVYCEALKYISKTASAILEDLKLYYYAYGQELSTWTDVLFLTETTKDEQFFVEKTHSILDCLRSTESIVASGDVPISFYDEYKRLLNLEGLTNDAILNHYYHTIKGRLAAVAKVRDILESCEVKTDVNGCTNG